VLRTTGTGHLFIDPNGLVPLAKKISWLEKCDPKPTHFLQTAVKGGVLKEMGELGAYCRLACKSFSPTRRAGWGLESDLGQSNEAKLLRGGHLWVAARSLSGNTVKLSSNGCASCSSSE